MVQDLAGVVEDGGEGAGRGAHGGRDDDLLQGHGLELRAGDEFVEIVHVGLQVLAVVEGEGLGTDRGRESIERVRQRN